MSNTYGDTALRRQSTELPHPLRCSASMARIANGGPGDGDYLPGTCIVIMTTRGLVQMIVMLRSHGLQVGQSLGSLR